MDNNFAAFILTHGRADNVITYETLKKTGYTGKIYIVIDNEDKTSKDYYDRFGDKVVVFDKKKISETLDEADNIYSSGLGAKLQLKLNPDSLYMTKDEFCKYIFIVVIPNLPGDLARHKGEDCKDKPYILILIDNHSSRDNPQLIDNILKHQSGSLSSRSMG